MDFMQVNFESAIPQHQQLTFYQEAYESTNLSDHACQRCNRVFSNFTAKIQHLAFSANHNHCSNEDYDSEEILDHLVNSPDHSFCEVCNEHFDKTGRGQIYLNHILNNTHHQYFCNSCQLDLITPEELDEHLECVHFCCVRCEEQCGTKEKLVEHRESSERHWVCHECLLDFPVKVQLLQHQKTHQPRNITCPSCNAGFASNSALIIHWENGACHVSRDLLNQYICHFDINGTLVPHAYRQSMSYNELRMKQARECDWNETMHGWECSLCEAKNVPNRYFESFIGLDQHLASPSHDASAFRCNGCAKEGKESEFTCLSSLVQHVEDTGCGNGGKGERARELMEFLCSIMNDFQSV